MGTLHTKASRLADDSKHPAVYDPNEDYFAVDPEKMTAAFVRLKTFVLHRTRSDSTIVSKRLVHTHKSSHHFA